MKDSKLWFQIIVPTVVAILFGGLVILLPKISFQLSHYALSLEFNLGNCITLKHTYSGIPLCCFLSSCEKYNQAANSCYNKQHSRNKPDDETDSPFFFGRTEYCNPQKDIKPKHRERHSAYQQECFQPF